MGGLSLAQTRALLGHKFAQTTLRYADHLTEAIREYSQRTADRSAARWLDELVNNAGVMQEARAEDMSLKDFERSIAVNLTTPFMLIKAALPHLRKDRGSIVNIGSIEGIGTNPRHAAYSASKAGLHGLTRSIGVDHGLESIRCNTVALGWIDTDLNMEFIESMPDPAAFRRNIGNIHPIGRTAKPEEVAT